MSLIGRTLKFTAGGLTGAAVGAIAALLLAPDSGNDLQRKLRERIATAKAAGFEAKAIKEAELIRKFRVKVSDPVALKSIEERVNLERARAATAL